MDTEANWNVERLPEHMQDEAYKYVEHGRRPGGFLRAFFAGDLFGVYIHADNVNLAALDEWMRWTYNDIPSGCWGSEKAVNDWVANGGMEQYEE